MHALYRGKTRPLYLVCICEGDKKCWKRHKTPILEEADLARDKMMNFPVKISSLGQTKVFNVEDRDRYVLLEDREEFCRRSC